MSASTSSPVANSCSAPTTGVSTPTGCGQPAGETVENEKERKNRKNKKK